jgi:ribosome biogenesis GTPase
MEQNDVETIICFNKTDLKEFGKYEEQCRSYTKSGYKVLFVSAGSGEGMEQLQNLTKNKTTVFAGPSGVGKSTTLNYLFPDAQAKTGALSEKIKRGRHTTRHSELMCIDDDTYIMDTPGFSSLYIAGIEAEDLKNYYPDINKYSGKCRFNMCNHISEPDCMVKNEVANGEISSVRYDNYVMLYNELKEKRKW